MPRALEDLLQYGVLGCRPVDPAALHRPEVDDVADEEQVLRVVRLQKLEQTLGLAGARAQVDVGEEDRPDLVRPRSPVPAFTHLRFRMRFPVQPSGCVLYAVNLPPP